MDSWFATIIATLFLLEGVLSTTGEFEQAPCPNRCSYEPYEAMTISCSGQHVTTQVPKITKHLTLFGCQFGDFLKSSNLSSIRSVTMINGHEPYNNPVGLFGFFRHVVCLKLEGRMLFWGGNNKAFEPLKSLEYLELNGTVFYSRADYQFHLSGFQENYKLQSVVLSYYIYKDEMIVNIKDIYSPFREVKPRCFTYQNEAKLVLDIKDVLDTSIFQIIQHFEIFRIRDILDLTTIHEVDGLFPAFLSPDMRLKVLESSNALRFYYRNSNCSSTNKDVVSKDATKYINANNFTFLDKCPGSKFMLSFEMSLLEKIILHHSMIYYECSGFFETGCIFAINSKIKHVDLSYLIQKNVNVFNTIFYGLTELLYLNIEGNLVSHLPDLFFHFVPKLEELFMGKNRLGNLLEKDKNGTLFSKLNRLRHLDLSSNNIKRLPSNIFKGLNELSFIDLTDNSLIQFEVNMWQINGINMIVLKRNEISSISSNTSDVFDNVVQRNSNFTVDLSDNSMSCSCGDIASIKWLQTTRAILLNVDSYLCKNVQGQKIILKNINVDVLHNFCHPLTNGQIAGIIVSVTIFNMIVIFFIVAYKKRHEWRYKLFRIYYYRSTTRNYTQFKYDGYVCYSSEDYEWVQNQLLSNLEVEHGLKLCLDKRDFVVGNYITNNILESIEESRKTILIISPNFVKSQWCEYEMHMAHQKFLDQGHDVIVPVLYQELKGKQGNHLLKTIIRMKTYIAWDINETENFWKNLKEAIVR